MINVVSTWTVQNLTKSNISYFIGVYFFIEDYLR